MKPNNSNAVERDTKYSWIVCIATMGMSFLLIGTLKSSGVIFVALKDYHGIPRSQSAIITSATFGSMYATSVVIGAIVHRFGYRRTFLVGSGIAFSGPFCSYFLTEEKYLVFSIGVVQGIGLGFIHVPKMAIIGHYFKRYLGAATGLSMAGSGLGSAVMPPLVEYIIGQYGLRGTFLIYSGMLLHFLVFSMMILDPMEEAAERQNEVESQGDKTLRGKVVHLLKNKYTYGVIFLNLALQSGVAGFSLSIPDFAVLGGASLLKASYLMSIAFSIDVLFRVLTGIFIDRHFMRLSFSYAICSFGGGLTFFCIGLYGGHSYLVLAILSSIFGAFFGGSMIHLPVNATRCLGKENTHLVLSISSVLLSLMTFGIGPLMTKMFSVFGGYSEFYYVLGSLFVSSALYWACLGTLDRISARTQH